MRIMNLFVKADPISRTFAQALYRLEDEYVEHIVKEYYQACCQRYTTVFFEWRAVVDNLVAEGVVDLTDGYYFPFLQERKVLSFESIDYEVTWDKR